MPSALDVIFSRNPPIMDEITSYLKDLDVSVLKNNRATMKVVLGNIKPFITNLSNSKSTTDKIQEILKMCKKSDLLDLSKKIKIENMIYNGCGSKVLEIFIEMDSGHILKLFVKKNKKKILNDGCATHVLRIMIEKGFYFSIKPENIDFEKEDVLTTVNVFLAQEFKIEGEKNENSSDKQSDSDEDKNENTKKDEIIKAEKSKKILTDYIIENYIDLGHIQSKKHCFFIENFIKSVDSEQFKKIYKKLFDQVELLSTCPFGNFAVQKLIEKCENVEEIIQKLDFNKVHENIFIKVLSKLQEENKNEKVENFIQEYHRSLKNFMFNGDQINKRTLPVLKKLFMLKKQNLDINQVFVDNFNSNSMKGNIECVKYYLFGTDIPENKERFVKNMKDECWGKKGEQVLVWMSRVCSFDSREEILSVMRKRRKISNR